MKNIAFFCIPAYGHTNPMLPVAKQLVQCGNHIRFYSFDEFKEKIQATGAEFVSCNRFLPKLTDKEQAGLMKISTTEMTIQDIRITLAMDKFLGEEIASFKPDVIYTDSVCFWGKLTAWKHQIPMVVSTSTFAFNQFSSTYMKISPSEMADMIFGLPKISKELKKLEPYGYHVKSALSLVQSDDSTDSVVYTSRTFQPYAESFSNHYAFVGPSVFSDAIPEKGKSRPLIYISMGTVINDRPDFYLKCIDSLKNLDADTLISCGNYIKIDELGELPENIKVEPYVDQLDVLSRADAFITHCGMNSVSESLYMATPMILYPQTGEQHAVARRASELGAGLMLQDDSVNGIRSAVQEVLNNASYSSAASECSSDFRSYSGTYGAAEFIENAPHTAAANTLIQEVNKANGRFNSIYWLTAIILIILLGTLVSWKYVWIIGLIAGIMNYPIGKKMQSRNYNILAKRNKNTN